MKKDDLHSVYTSEYAESYDDRFHHSPISVAFSQFEYELLRSLIKPDTEWLDVGCGTGYFLNKFPGVKRAGMDLTPAMLEKAKSVNPDALFFREGDMRIWIPEWKDKWSLVSCMWGAYIYVDSLEEVEHSMLNLVSYIRPGGTFFLPVIGIDELYPFNNLIYEFNISDYGGKIQINSVTWNWIESEGGKVHSNLISPHTGHFINLLSPWFEKVEVVNYPESPIARRAAIVATGKRRNPEPGKAVIHWPVNRRPPLPVDISNKYLVKELLRRIKSGEFLKAAWRRIVG